MVSSQVSLTNFPALLSKGHHGTLQARKSWSGLSICLQSHFKVALHWHCKLKPTWMWMLCKYVMQSNIPVSRGTIHVYGTVQYFSPVRAWNKMWSSTLKGSIKSAQITRDFAFIVICSLIANLKHSPFHWYKLVVLEQQLYTHNVSVHASITCWPTSIWLCITLCQTQLEDDSKYDYIVMFTSATCSALVSCAARVTVLGLSFRLSICPVCYRDFCHYMQQGSQKVIPRQDCKSTAFKNYGVEKEQKSHMNTASPWHFCTLWKHHKLLKGQS